MQIAAQQHCYQLLISTIHISHLQRGGSGVTGAYTKRLELMEKNRMEHPGNTRRQVLR